MRIRKIEIQKIRGICLLEIPLDIHPNKPTFFVAPNGFGKTSIATVFNSMNRNKIKLPNEYRHNNDQTAEPLIRITDDNDTVYYANHTSNTISTEFSVFVINNQIRPKASARKFDGHFSSTPSLAIDPIVLYQTIPNRADFSYSYSDMKRNLGNSAGKLLINLTPQIKNPNFVRCFSQVRTQLKKLLQSRNSKKIESFLSEINSLTGTKQAIANSAIGTILLQSDIINTVIERFDSLFSGLTQIEKLVNAIQLRELFNNNRDNLSNIIDYYNYIFAEKEINEMLGFFNCTWKNIKAREKSSELVIEFPKANQISNGERDVLCFIGKLFEARNKLRKEKAILVIDEIFDYLDDANLIAAQYYLTKFIDQFKKSGRELFLIILTHLDPMFFNTYSFSTKNVIYLNKINRLTNKHKINNLLKDRERCKKTDKERYDRISTHYLHYSHTNIDESEYLQTLGVETELLTSESFQRTAMQELENYCSGMDFDPALVCCGLRICIEKKAYEQLSEQNQKDEFLTIHKTTDKLEYAKKKGAIVPEVYFLLSIIYNEAMHLDDQCKKLNPISYKLRNKVIHNMISEICEVDDNAP
jgi:hypothetical protein